eukprot:Lithocolla_globosa_v1_NODE_4389_length_1447_cov_46.732759.p2 type:complete len:233 gc:universal NODE_4389_length_1447_cov_46.732759:364-1062(+)
MTNCSQHLTDETISSAQGGVDFGAHADQPPGHGKLQVIRLGVQRQNARIDGLAPGSPLAVLGNNPWPHLNLITNLEDTHQDTATGHSSLQTVHFRAGFVHIKRSDHNQSRDRREITDWNGDFLDNVLTHGVDVVLELCGNGYDWGLVSDSAFDKVQDLLVLFLCCWFAHQIDLVLEDQNVFELHDLNGSQVLRGLGLRAGLVSCNQKQCSVHDGGTVQHGGHQDIVARAVHK